MQVREDFFNIGRFKRLKVVSIYGRAPFYNQQRELKQKTHIVVGTPGRIIDHIDRGTLDISTFVEILNGKGEMVLEKLQTTTIKGRLRNVNKANE